MQNIIYAYETSIAESNTSYLANDYCFTDSGKLSAETIEQAANQLSAIIAPYYESDYRYMISQDYNQADIYFIDLYSNKTFGYACISQIKKGK